jgi:hypothetical protein
MSSTEEKAALDAIKDALRPHVGEALDSFAELLGELTRDRYRSGNLWRHRELIGGNAPTNGAGPAGIDAMVLTFRVR